MIKKFFLAIFILAFFGSLHAGVTGKIAGQIVDATTKEPLPGVNIIVEGTIMGGSTDEDGFYVILNVPPGTYQLQALYVGYTTMIFSEVRVSVDLTTRIDIQMSETTLETSETITVVAERPMIRKDEISTRHFVSAQEIEIQPVTNFQQIARNQPGVVGNSFRGGRSGEVLVLIDGIPVRDPAGVYAGNLGGFTGDLPEYGIQEMEVSLGGFSAEYGNVQSGLLNLALKEGSSAISGRLRFTNQAKFGSASSFKMNDIEFERLQPLLNIYELNVNGPIIPGKLTFSLSGEITDQAQGMYLNQQSFDQSYQGKLTYRFTPTMKLALGGILSRSAWDTYYFQASKYGPGKGYQTDIYNAGVKQGTDTLVVYRYVKDKNKYGNIESADTPGGVAADGQSYNVTRTYYMAGMQDYQWDREKGTNLGYLHWTHALSAKTYYEIRMNNFYSFYEYATRDIDDRDGDGNRDEKLQWDLAKEGPHPLYLEREENYWWIRGDDPGHLDQKSTTNTLKVDMISQVTRNHLIKGGIETSLHRTQVENISWTLGVGINRKDIWDQRSFDFAAYIQDKLEFQGINALIGVRFDAFDPNGLGEPIVYPADYNAPYSQVDENGIPIFINPKKAKTKFQWSPRIGISHPVTEASVLHFSYGHYFQRPDGYYLYRNNKIQSLTKVGNYIGNPALDPEKTVSYEIGVEQQIANDYKVTLTGYYKDVTNLMNWEKYVGRTIQNTELNVFTNADYGNIKGMEVTFSKRPGRFWGANVNYTYSIAKGRSSSALGGSGEFTSVKRMNILNFDQTHTAKANITLRTPDDFSFALGPMHPLGNWLANIQFSYGSGLPYSSYGSNKINDERRPWTSTTDLKLMRQIQWGRYGINLFTDVYNVFDRKNVNWIGSSLYYDAGHSSDESLKGDPSVVRRMADGTFIRNAQAYSAGRQVRLGIGLNF